MTDRQWAIIAPLVPGKQGDHGRTGTDNRLFLGAILWRARSASPRRDLSPEPCNWRSGPSRFRHRTIAGVWARLFNAVRADPGFGYVLVDATICKTHADATSQKGGLDAAGIGRSKGGLTIARQHMLACVRVDQDPCGGGCAWPAAPVHDPARPMGGPQAQGLTEGRTEAQHVIMDATCDADHLRAFIADHLGARAHIKRNRECPGCC